MSSTSHTGEALVVTWNADALEADFRTLTITETVNDADGTSGADAYVRHLPTQTDANIALELVSITGTAGTATWAGLVPEGTGTLVWYPEGTATGYRYGSVSCYVSGRTETIPYNDVATWAITFLPQSAITHGFN
jgi:hypothetical protein